MKLLTIIFSVLPAILAGDFVPQTLSIAEQDSILNVQSAKEEVACTRYRLEYENEEKLFRHSREADWFVLDAMRHTRKQLGAGLQLGKVRDAVMSPNGRYVAFAKGNNLYIHKLDFGTEVAVTKDENTDIINGIADWLYEEEFGTTALFAWTPKCLRSAGSTIWIPRTRRPTACVTRKPVSRTPKLACASMTWLPKAS